MPPRHDTLVDKEDVPVQQDTSSVQVVDNDDVHPKKSVWFVTPENVAPSLSDNEHGPPDSTINSIQDESDINIFFVNE